VAAYRGVYCIDCCLPSTACQKRRRGTYPQNLHQATTMWHNLTQPNTAAVRLYTSRKYTHSLIHYFMLNPFLTAARFSADKIRTQLTQNGWFPLSTVSVGMYLMRRSFIYLIWMMRRWTCRLCC